MLIVYEVASSTEGNALLVLNVVSALFALHSSDVKCSVCVAILFTNGKVDLI